MFASPTFTGTVAGVTSTHVGLGNVANKRQVDLDLGNAPSAIKNDDLALSVTTSGLYKGRVSLTTNPSGDGFFTILANTAGGSPFDSSGNVATGEVITVGSQMTIDRDNERILIED